MMKILVVGSSSFVGKAILSLNQNPSHQFVGLQRSATDKNAMLETHSWRLGEEIPVQALRGAVWIIFCAHDLDAPAQTESGYIILLNQLEVYKEIKCVFVSSYSAFQDAPSEYGQTKYLIETEFLKRGHYVVRPGLIMGNGGMFATLVENILRYPIVPVIGFNDAPIFSIGIEDLCRFILKIIDTAPDKKEYNAMYPNTYTQVELAKAVKISRGKRLFYLRLPIVFFEVAVFIFQLLRLKPPITKENLKGYRRNTKEIRASDIQFLGNLKTKPLERFLKT